MPTTTRATKSVGGRRSAFTLVEVMISTALTVVVMAGVLSAMLMILRTGYSVQQYTEMEQQSRVSLEFFGEDVRMAKTADWVNQNQVKLTVPIDNASGTKQIEYTYDAAAKTLTRLDQGALEQVLMAGERGTVAVFPATADSALALLITKEARLGLILHVAARAAEQIRAIIDNR